VTRLGCGSRQGRYGDEDYIKKVSNLSAEIPWRLVGSADRALGRRCCDDTIWAQTRGAHQGGTDRSGRIKVNRDLTIPAFRTFSSIGDLALVVDEKGKQLPGVAQVAMQGGTYAAKAIRSRLEGKTELPAFHYFNKGDMAVIGRAAAVANIFGFHVSGLPAWLIWLFVHLIYIVEFQSRVIVFIQWD